MRFKLNQCKRVIFFVFLLANQSIYITRPWITGFTGKITLKVCPGSFELFRMFEKFTSPQFSNQSAETFNVIGQYFKMPLRMVGDYNYWMTGKLREYIGFFIRVIGWDKYKTEAAFGAKGYLFINNKPIVVVVQSF